METQDDAWAVNFDSSICVRPGLSPAIVGRTGIMYSIIASVMELTNITRKG